jgi:4-hydroxy-3-methylbut-2-enyl diphosphate reductase LytB-like protein/phosphorylase superfamily protein
VSHPPLVCTPLLVEQLALGHLPGTPVRRTGMGPRPALPDGPGLVAGVAGSLSVDVRPGDVVVASEVRGPGIPVPVPSAPMLAGALRRLGLRVHVGPIVSMTRPVDGAARRELAATGALAVDMESAFLAPATGPFAVVRTIVDTPDHPLWRLGTVVRGITALRTLRRAAPAIAQWTAATNWAGWRGAGQAPREVLLASPRPFRAGVQRAVEVVDRALEVEGNRGEALDHALVVEDAAAVVAAPDPLRVGYARQTAPAVDEGAAIARVPRGRLPALSGPRRDDIRYTTTNRQQAVRAVAAESDLVLVASSGNSSNAPLLVEVVEREGVPAYLVDDAGDVDLRWLAGVRRIGLTAGASAPPHLVADLVRGLTGLGPLTLRETQVVDENIRFTLPREVT